MSDGALIDRNWIRVGVATGVVAVVSFPLIVYVPMPRFLTLMVAGSFGPALGFASFGLHRLLRLHRDSVTSQIAAISNMVAGALVTAMLMTQFATAVRRDDYFARVSDDEAIRTIIRWVWDVNLGLDIAFDVYIGLGTTLFGFAMLRHPRFGRVVGGLGILAGALIIIFNFATFPENPGTQGLVDTGPTTGLWYLIVVILTWRSLPWVDEQLAERYASDQSSG